MKVESINFLAGRNIYSHHPVLRLILDLEVLKEKTTTDFPQFIDQIIACLPGLKKHHCSLGFEGGFCRRMNEGTYFGHVFEHMLLELENMGGIAAIYGRTRETKRAGVYEIVVECSSEECGRSAVALAIELLNALLFGHKIPDLTQGIREIKKQIEKRQLGPSAAAIAAAAQNRGIPVQRLDNASLLQLGYGKYQQLVQATITGKSSCIGVDIACNKDLTKKLLARAGIPVPPGEMVKSLTEALEAGARIGYPVVIKPYNGNQGKGVSLNLTGEKEITEAYALASAYSDSVLVEKQITGRHYRILVIGERAVAAAERIPAYVVGDGKHTVVQLIERENKDPRRGEGHEKILTRIKIDEIVLQVLKRKKISLSHIPDKGEQVFLRENANLSTGGIAVDVTDQVHPENAAVAVQAAKVVGLDVAGIDLVLPDIARPLITSDGVVIEVNAAPGLRMHLYPAAGQGRDVGKDIVDYLFPPGKPSHVPIVSVTGTNGKTTTTRLIAHILSCSGYVVGAATTDGIWVKNRCLVRGDTTGPWSARLVLSNTDVEAAVLETARGGILREGLGYAESDVGVITNISPDHLGQDGLKQVEDLAFVKSLVVEAVKRDGYAVVNADDPLVSVLASRAPCSIIYFSLKEDNVLIRRHLSEKGEAVFILGDKMVVARGNEIKTIIAVSQLPIAMNGLAAHNIVNALAAAAACRGLGISPENIGKALAGFSSDLEHNPGRCNLFNVGSYRVLIDYGHNPAGYQAVIELARRLEHQRLLGVIGVPGDRSDHLVVKTGQIAGSGFDLLFIKEDRNRRGRAPGEIARLLYQGALEGGLHTDNIQLILSEEEAVKKALTIAGSGDLIVVFYEYLEPLLEAIGVAKSLPARPFSFPKVIGPVMEASGLGRRSD